MANRQFHFVVYWSEEDGNWCVDNETCAIFMDEGTIYDTSEEGEWRQVEQGEEERLNYLLALELRDLIFNDNGEGTS